MFKNGLCSILFVLAVFIGLTGQTWRQGDHQDRSEPRQIRAIHPTDSRWDNRRSNSWRPRYNFYQNGYHFYPYVYSSPTVYMSSNYAPVTYSGGTYYYDQGLFYQDLGGQSYAAVPPPVGAVVSTLPTGTIQVSSRGSVYHIFNQVYYKPVAGGYQVVEPVR